MRDLYVATPRTLSTIVHGNKYGLNSTDLPAYLPH